MSKTWQIIGDQKSLIDSQFNYTRHEPKLGDDGKQLKNSVGDPLEQPVTYSIGDEIEMPDDWQPITKNKQGNVVDVSVLAGRVVLAGSAAQKRAMNQSSADAAADTAKMVDYISKLKTKEQVAQASDMEEMGLNRDEVIAAAEARYVELGGSLEDEQEIANAAQAKKAAPKGINTPAPLPVAPSPKVS